jgi:hypothetical protein
MVTTRLREGCIDAMRRAPNLTEKLAAALLEIDRLRALLFKYPRVCPYEEAKQLTAEQIIVRWSFDHHPVRYVDREVVTSLGIPDIHHPTNLSPTTHPEHARKTYEVDIPQNAKRKRIEKKRRPGERVREYVEPTTFDEPSAFGRCEMRQREGTVQSDGTVKWDSAPALSDVELGEVLRRAWDRAVPRTKPSRWPPKGSRPFPKRMRP